MGIILAPPPVGLGGSFKESFCMSEMTWTRKLWLGILSIVQRYFVVCSFGFFGVGAVLLRSVAFQRTANTVSPCRSGARISLPSISLSGHNSVCAEPLWRRKNGEQAPLPSARRVSVIHWLNEQTPAFCPPLSLVVPAPQKAIKSPLQKPWEGVVRSCFKRPQRGRGHRSNWQSIAEDRRSPLVVPPHELLTLKALDKVHFSVYHFFFLPYFSSQSTADETQLKARNRPLGFNNLDSKLWG